MTKWTVVYIPEDGAPGCMGQFSTRTGADKFAEKCERDLDEERDPAGGGVGDVYVCAIGRMSDWACV